MSFYKDFRDRNQRLILTMISKQWLGFYIATILLWYKTITPEVWASSFLIVVSSDVVQKLNNVGQATPSQEPPQ